MYSARGYLTQIELSCFKTVLNSAMKRPFERGAGGGVRIVVMAEMRQNPQQLLLQRVTRSLRKEHSFPDVYAFLLWCLKRDAVWLLCIGGGSSTLTLV